MIVNFNLLIKRGWEHFDNSGIMCLRLLDKLKILGNAVAGQAAPVHVKGAEFTVKLQSDIDKNGWDNAKTHDMLVTDEKGYALSKELPYGKYLVRETKVPKDLYTTKDFTVTVTEDSREPQQWRVFNDGPFKAYIRIVKKDAENGNTVLLPGVTFKIKNTDTDEYVEQKVGDKKISECRNTGSLCNRK